MKKILTVFSVLLSGTVIALQAQSADTHKLAAYSVDDSIKTVQPLLKEKVLAPYAIDSPAKAPANSTQKPAQELMPAKKEEPETGPK